MITKNSDFVGRFSIANAIDNEPNREGNSEELQIFIDDFEPECLVTVLGYTLYELLKPELDKKPFNPASPDDADQIWIDLVNGKDNYQGLLKVTVPYIYFKFLEDDNDHHTGVGIMQETPKGGVRTNATKKAVTAWRQYFKFTVGNESNNTFLVRDSIKGPIAGIIYDQEDKYHPLYKFLRDNLATYPDWAPSKIYNINEYGI